MVNKKQDQFPCNHATCAPCYLMIKKTDLRKEEDIVVIEESEQEFVPSCPWCRTLITRITRFNVRTCFD